MSLRSCYAHYSADYTVVFIPGVIYAVLPGVLQGEGVWAKRRDIRGLLRHMETPGKTVIAEEREAITKERTGEVDEPPSGMVAIHHEVVPQVF